MTPGEMHIFFLVENAPNFSKFKAVYNQLVGMIANRVASEFSEEGYDWDLAEKALTESDTGDETSQAYFERFEVRLREKYAARTLPESKGAIDV